MNLDCTSATTADAPILAQMNRELIKDERHRNSMSLPELEQRMQRWHVGAYEAVLFSVAGNVVGYALFRPDTDWVYLRQFFVAREHRRQGIGRTAFAWLKCHAWRNTQRIRLDDLVHNEAAIAFWRSVGFADYCLTMEVELTEVKHG